MILYVPYPILGGMLKSYCSSDMFWIHFDEVLFDLHRDHACFGVGRKLCICN